MEVELGGTIEGKGGGKGKIGAEGGAAGKVSREGES